MDKRRIEVSTSAPGIGNNFIDVDFDKGQVLNVHGYRAMVSIEPQDADANANGMIGIWVLPGGMVQNADLPTTFGDFGNEIRAPYLWGIMPWTASNQTPYQWEFSPKTSRTLQAGARIVLQVLTSGISAGLLRLNIVQTMFTSSVK